MPDSETGSKPTVFVGESTGLVENVSFLDSIALNISNMSIGGLLGGLGINPLSGGFNMFSIIVEASLYPGARQMLRKKGIDISLGYKELPPE